MSVKLRFCPESNDLLYPKEDKERKKLVYVCRSCQYKEDADPSNWRVAAIAAGAALACSAASRLHSAAPRLAAARLLPALAARCVYRNEVHHTSKEKSVVLQDVRSDPTLPRTKDVRCPSCAHNEAVFFSASTEEGMTLFFNCCQCGHSEGRGIRFRTGREDDLPTVRAWIVRGRMNPIAVLSGAKQWTMAEGPNGQLLGCGRLRDIEAQAGGAVELSSLVVAEEARGQGLGSQLLAELLRRAGEREVWLTTIGRRVAFYERAGFREVPLFAAPGAMIFEGLAGMVVARIAAGDRLAVMSSVGGWRQRRWEATTTGRPKEEA
eukprot:scaffold3.g6552.t1